jgi:poly(3-hydroxybutyrate) depolymerase
MERPLTTSNVPKKFLKACLMVGHVPLKALACDPRVSYALYIPPTRYDADPNPTKLPLLVWVHGTGRKWNTLYEDGMVSFADRMPCAILAPLFPAGLDGPNDLDSYKMLHSSSLQSDQALLEILDEVSVRWPGIHTDNFFLHGFSGGGQFAHRFLYLYPERLAAVSVGAPGRVTALNFSKNWPEGIADTNILFGREVVPGNIRKVSIQLVVGSEDNKVHGGEAFWTWLEKFENKKEEKKLESTGLSHMEIGRLQTLEELHRSWKTVGIDSQLNIVPGVAHDAGRIRPAMLRFMEPLIRTDIEK